MTDTRKPEFVIGRPDETTKAQEITRVAKVDTLLIEFKDVQGATKVNMGFRHPEAEVCFLLQEKIGGAFVATKANRWFNNSLNNYLRAHGFSTKGVELSQEEGVEQV